MSQADIVRTYVIQSGNGEVISCEDLHASHPAYSVDAIFKFLHHPKITAYLVERHNLLPPPRQKSRRTLTDRQRTWLAIVTDPYTTASLSTLIKKANEDGVFGVKNISLAEHRRWMKQPAFLAEYQRLLSSELRGTEGEIVRRTATKAMMGDPKSAELLYRMQGKPLPNALAPGQGGGISLDLVMQVLQRICTSEQLQKAAVLFMNPDAPLELVQGEDDVYSAGYDDDDISVPQYTGPQPGTEER